MGEVKNTTYTFTSKEAYTIPVYRISGNKETLILVDNRNTDKIMLPSMAVGSLIEQLIKYKAFIEEEDVEAKEE